VGGSNQNPPRESKTWEATSVSTKFRDNTRMHSLIHLINDNQQKIRHTFAQSPSQSIILLAASNISSKAVRVVYKAMTNK